MKSRRVQTAVRGCQPAAQRTEPNCRTEEESREASEKKRGPKPSANGGGKAFEAAECKRRGRRSFCFLRKDGRRRGTAATNADDSIACAVNSSCVNPEKPAGAGGRGSAANQNSIQQTSLQVYTNQQRALREASLTGNAGLDRLRRRTAASPEIRRDEVYPKSFFKF